MRIGVDFDNTIVCYDQLFLRLAQEKGLAPAGLPANKGAVRDHLRAIGKEDVWTEMQGEAYGSQIRGALPFPGVKDFFRECVRAGVDVFIVSHKTLHPFKGPQYDLHAAARDWLEFQGFFDPAPRNIGLARERVFLELTKVEKVERIAALDCTHFIDDLPEFLAEPGFPAKTRKILFDPASAVPPAEIYTRLKSWEQIASALLGPARASS
ncbi:MAG: haloacid dehalogenase-like hydrolase [Planctomycetota bacterium]|nr:haloacid dehalogenase-like hydrolase [Planctomycetota bacterium]